MMRVGKRLRRRQETSEKASGDSRNDEL